MSAIILFIFNRPHTTERVFATIRRARPRKLYIYADGPRPQMPEDVASCQAARRATEQVDWSCEVVRHYAKTNLGIKQRVESGLAHTFVHEEHAIVLEDDCVPDVTFFDYCAELLKRYKTNPHIMSIGGSNFHFGRYKPPASYYFSRYPLLWGWATWRRAWRQYNATMHDWPQAHAEHWLNTLFHREAQRRYWTYIFKRNHAQQDNWDYAWMYSCWRRGGLSITPSVNLVSNIGFDPTATHTRNRSSPLADLATSPIDTPLHHPAAVAIDAEADQLTEANRFSGPEFTKPLFDAIRASRRS